MADEQDSSGQDDLWAFLKEASSKIEESSSPDTPSSATTTPAEPQPQRSAQSESTPIPIPTIDTSTATTSSSETAVASNPRTPVAASTVGSIGSPSSPPQKTYFDEKKEEEILKIDNSIPKPEPPDYLKDEEGHRIVSREKLPPCHRFVFTEEEAPFSQPFSSVRMEEFCPHPVTFEKRKIPVPFPPLGFYRQNDIRTKMLTDIWAAQEQLKQHQDGADPKTSHPHFASPSSSSSSSVSAARGEQDFRKRTSVYDSNVLSTDVLLLDPQKLSELKKEWARISHLIGSSSGKSEINMIGKIVPVKVHISNSETLLVRIPFDHIHSIETLMTCIMEATKNAGGVPLKCLAAQIAKYSEGSRPQPTTTEGSIPSTPMIDTDSISIEDIPPLMYRDSEGDLFLLKKIQDWDDAVHNYESSGLNSIRLYFRESRTVWMKCFGPKAGTDDSGSVIDVASESSTPQKNVFYLCFPSNAAVCDLNAVMLQVRDKLQLTTSPKLRYKDAEGSLVDISSQEDWNFAILSSSSTLSGTESGLVIHPVVLYSAK